MVAVRFIGDPRHDGDGPASIVMWGHTFVKGVWTELAIPIEQTRIRNNDHFEVSETAKAEVPKPAEVVVEKAPETGPPGSIPANWREMHHSSRIKLAKALDADLAETIKTAADADQVIEWHEGKDNG